MNINKTHLISFSFDDGFRKSSYLTADIFERHGLRASINVIAISDTYAQPHDMGTFADWNILQARGHEIGAHTWDHANLPELPIEDAKWHIMKCEEYFTSQLEGFRASEAVYSFAYNASTPELEAFALTHFRAVRTQSESPVNPIPTSNQWVKLGCISGGPGNIDDRVEDLINQFLQSEGGWFIFNAHGLDDEGWGPMSHEYLDCLLARLVTIPSLSVLPVARALDAANVWPNF